MFVWSQKWSLIWFGLVGLGMLLQIMAIIASETRPLCGIGTGRDQSREILYMESALSKAKAFTCTLARLKFKDTICCRIRRPRMNGCELLLRTGAYQCGPPSSRQQKPMILIARATRLTESIESTSLTT